jgi:malate dehydrogenase
MKVSIVGAGKVGAAAGFAIAAGAEKISELVYVDVVEKLAQGEALDLQHAVSAMGRQLMIMGTRDFSALDASDVVIVTAGKAREPGMTREDLAKFNTPIVAGIAREIKRYAPDSIIIPVTNPLDAMTFVTFKESGFPRKRVMGMGGLLDTARLKSLGFDGVIIGAHGETMVPTSQRVSESDVARIRQTAADVISLKGATVYAPAACIAKTVRAIASDSKETIPCCCVLDGEYGERNIAIGVLAVVGAGGVERIEAAQLNQAQKAMWKQSVEAVRAQLRAIGY